MHIVSIDWLSQNVGEQEPIPIFNSLYIHHILCVCVVCVFVRFFRASINLWTQIKLFFGDFLCVACPYDQVQVALWEVYVFHFICPFWNGNDLMPLSQRAIYMLNFIKRRKKV